MEKEFFKQLDLFLKSDLRNKWITTEHLKIYVRKSKRIYDDSFIDCLDLATITIEVPGQGTFTKIVDTLISSYNRNIFVESILEKRLHKFLIEKKGFVIYKNDSYSVIKKYVK